METVIDILRRCALGFAAMIASGAWAQAQNTHPLADPARLQAEAVAREQASLMQEDPDLPQLPSQALPAPQPAAPGAAQTPPAASLAVQPNATAQAAAPQAAPPQAVPAAPPPASVGAPPAANPADTGFFRPQPDPALTSLPPVSIAPAATTAAASVPLQRNPANASAIEAVESAAVLERLRSIETIMARSDARATVPPPAPIYQPPTFHYPGWNGETDPERR